MHKTAVIYARFSCSKQREASIEDQVRVCREWCEREGYEVLKVYSDMARSGRTDDRPSFKQMIANAGESDIVLVYMMDRFSRNEFDAPIYKRELKNKGVRLESAMEAIPDTPEGIIYEKLLEGLAAFESRKTAIRVKRGMEGNAAKCLVNGARLFGYKKGIDGRYEIDPKTAPYVVEMFERRLKGETGYQIAKDMANRGIRGTSGNLINPNNVYRVLENECYTGVYKWSDTRIEGGMPRIISDDQFLEVQMMKKTRRRDREVWAEYLLSGRVVCSECGSNMPGVSGHGKSQVYRYYACKKCKAVKPIRADWLEEEIGKAIQENLTGAGAKQIAEIVSKAKSSAGIADKRRSAKKRLQDTENAIKNTLSVIEQGGWTPSINDRLHELEAEKEDAQKAIETLDEQDFKADLFCDFLHVMAKNSPRFLVDAMVYQAFVSNDDVLVTLNYDTKTGEPARFSVSRVRPDLEGCPQRDSNP